MGCDNRWGNVRQIPLQPQLAKREGLENSLAFPSGWIRPLPCEKWGGGGMRMIPSAQAQGDAMRKRPVGPPNTGPAPASPFDWPPLAIQASG